MSQPCLFKDLPVGARFTFWQGGAPHTKVTADGYEGPSTFGNALVCGENCKVMPVEVYGRDAGLTGDGGPKAFTEDPRREEWTEEGQS